MDREREPWQLRSEEDNLTVLPDLNETSLLAKISQRYHDDRIYTDVGDILVAVNPFKRLSIYDDRWSAAYTSPEAGRMVPHVYRVAARAYTSMVHSKRDQVCVISGESGAGKTESAKRIMQQLMNMCPTAGLGRKLQEKIIQLNPILEAFGNASTALNKNSSRFGKFVQLLFSQNGRIKGAGLEEYLLEKSRLCFQPIGERNYHIFYYMFAGLSSQDANKLYLQDPSKHRYLKSSSSLQSDCHSAENRDSFLSVLSSMESMGFAGEDVQQVMKVLAAILHIGDIDFVAARGSDDTASVTNKQTTALIASQLLQIDNDDDLCFALTTLRTTTRGETVDKLYSCRKAADVRDAMAKALYSRLFHWIVAHINKYLQPQDRKETIGIGILDIFGFENFQTNSFEQLCINLANEQLQQYFNTQIFTMEKEEYSKEGLEGLDIKYQDNQPVLQLFLSRPIGIFSLLDEQCRSNGSEVALLQRYRDSLPRQSKYQPHKGNALVFTVKHYAGDVTYHAQGFLDKNRDSLPDPVMGVLKFSQLKLVKALFSRQQDTSVGVLTDNIKLKPSQKSVMKKMSVRRRKSRSFAKRKRKMGTVSSHFRESLEKLMERILSASPHFIRCIKPNVQCLPNHFDNDFVSKQLRYTGMLEAVRVRKEGFAYRPYFSDFVRDYRNIAFKFTVKDVRHCEATCVTILNKAGIIGWKLGKSRVFLRYYHQEVLNKLMKNIEDKAVLIQSVFRGYMSRKRTIPMLATQAGQKVLVTRLLNQIQQGSDESFEHVVTLNREDVMMAVSRFGHPDLRNSQTTVTTSPREANRVKKPVGGVPVLLGIGNISPVNTTPEPHYVKPRTVSEPLTPTGLDEDDEDDYATIPDDEYITMIPAPSPSPSPVGVKNDYSFHYRTTSRLPVIPRKSSAPERLHFATLAATKSKHHISEAPVPLPRSDKRMTVGNKQSIMTRGQQRDDYSSLENRLFIQETVRVSENPRSRSPLTNLVNGKSHSVPNLLAATDADLSHGLDQSSIRSLHSTTYSSEDLYQEIQDTLSLDSPLLHRVSSTFHSVDDTYSSGSECSSSLGSTGDLTTQPQNRKKSFLERLFNKKKKSPKKPYVATNEFTFGKPVNGQIDPLSNSELAGYLPGISELKANGMLQGQPRGSYLIFTGYSREGNFIFKLAVSQGRGHPVSVENIQSQHCHTSGVRGLSFTSDRWNQQPLFSNLVELTKYYRQHPVPKIGIVLTDPCLVQYQPQTGPLNQFIRKKKPVPLPPC